MKFVTLLFVCLGLSVSAVAAEKAETAKRKPASISNSSNLKTSVLNRKRLLEQMTKNELGTSKSFYIDYGTLNCVGAPTPETIEDTLMGVCTYQAGAWQTYGSFAVLVKYEGLEVKALFKDME
ncbi:MAG: hypothetical protein V4736_14370 [Bdellovibrionota bacterium]